MSNFVNLKNDVSLLLNCHPEYQYLNILRHLRNKAEKRQDRTGVGTHSVFGHFQMVFDLQKGFPLLTTKKTLFRLISSELEWFIKGDTNIHWLLEQNNHIWTEWPFMAWLKKTGQDKGFTPPGPGEEDGNQAWRDKKKEFENLILNDLSFARKWGSIGPGYGHQFRSWPASNGGAIDQLGLLIDSIKQNPYSRRHLISLWNAADIDKMLLPPCHTLTQFYVRGEFLDAKMYQRSADWFLGVPFNVASYALLLILVAKVTGHKPGIFFHTFGDAHLYSNHLQQATLQLKRKPIALPTLEVSNLDNLFHFDYRNLVLKDYHSHPYIPAPIAI